MPIYHFARKIQYSTAQWVVGMCWCDIHSFNPNSTFLGILDKHRHLATDDYLLPDVSELSLSIKVPSMSDCVALQDESIIDYSCE